MNDKIVNTCQDREPDKTMNDKIVDTCQDREPDKTMNNKTVGTCQEPVTGWSAKHVLKERGVVKSDSADGCVSM